MKGARGKRGGGSPLVRSCYGTQFGLNFKNNDSKLNLERGAFCITSKKTVKKIANFRKYTSASRRENHNKQSIDFTKVS